MRVVTMCGSLGPGSANRAALRVASDSLRARPGIVVDDAGGLDEVPAFAPQRADDPPASVARLDGLLASADALLLAAPEYAGGVAGSTKNVLDWLVGSGPLHHRVVAVLSAGTTGGAHAIEQLVRTLSWQGALVVSVLGVEAPRTKTGADGCIDDPATIAAIERWAGAAVDAVAASPSDRLARVARVVTAYGIDPARFGTLG